MRKITALLVASTLALGTVQLATAADTTSNSDAPAKGEMHHHKQGPMMDHMFKGLNLTEQQRQQMRDIARSSIKDMKKPTAAEHQQIHDIIAADSFDSAKAQTVVNAMSEEQNQRMLARLEMQNKMYNILTAEQKQQFNKKFQERAAKMSQSAAD